MKRKATKKRSSKAAPPKSRRKRSRQDQLGERIDRWYQGAERRDLERRIQAAAEAGWATWIRTRSDCQAVLEDCRFEPERCARFIDFCRLGIVQVNGRFRGRPLELLRWQVDSLAGPLFGWVTGRGTRRHRRGYVTVAKKNGKSGICAAIQLYGLMADGEHGANCKCAALDKIQAGLVFNEAVKYARASPKIKARVSVHQNTNRIVFAPTLSNLGVISSDVGNAEGLDVHFLIYDELHMARTDALYDVLRYAGAARDNSVCPLVITTAGSDLRSLCGREYLYAQRLIAGDVVDTAYLAAIYEAPRDCDLFDRNAWRAANPALGVILDEEVLANDATAAIAQGKVANFRRRRLNQWIEEEDLWIGATRWSGAATPVGEWPTEERLRALPCWLGLDLGNTSDTTSLALAWRDDEQARVYSRSLFWMPEETARKAAAQGVTQWLDWSRAGQLTLTPGRVTDYGRVRETMHELGALYQIREVAYDPWSAAPLINQLIADGLPMIKLPQTLAFLSPAMSELERQLGAGEHRHQAHPVMAWQMLNVRTWTDAQGNKRPDKRKSPEKIDGPAALINAIARLAVGGGDAGQLYGGTGIAIV